MDALARTHADCLVMYDEVFAAAAQNYRAQSRSQAVFKTYFSSVLGTLQRQQKSQSCIAGLDVQAIVRKCAHFYVRSEKAIEDMERQVLSSLQFKDYVDTPLAGESIRCTNTAESLEVLKRLITDSDSTRKRIKRVLHFLKQHSACRAQYVSVYKPAWKAYKKLKTQPDLFFTSVLRALQPEGTPSTARGTHRSAEFDAAAFIEGAADMCL